VKIEASHVPLSARASSDFPGCEEPACFVREKDNDSDVLVEQVFSQIDNLVISIGESVKRQLEPNLNALEEATSVALK
jgi:hypothetical protein